MKPRYARLMLIIILTALIVIDIIDGNMLKLVNTVLLSVSLVAFSFGYTNPKQRGWFIVGFIFGALAMAGFVYRIVQFTQQR